jgi:hypothetical protein
MVIQIALGVILALVILVAAPLVLSILLGLVARVAVTKPREMGPASTVLWTVRICVAIFAVLCIEAALHS